MLQMIDYSEKAFAVVGDTRPHKESLKAAGGRFNAKLSCGAGWIFSKRAADTVAGIVAKANGATTKEKGTAREKKGAGDNPLNGARVYVGTYAKYNAGSLGGRWLNLSDYANKDEFMAACRELHKDEADPEFMFQDFEGVPSWLISESHIDAEVWSQKPEKEKEGCQTKAEIRALLEKAGARGDLDYKVKTTAAAIEVGGRVFDFRKPTIETRFCHPDEPEEAARNWWKVCRTYDYFRGENLRGLDGQIEKLKGAALGSLDGAFIYREGSGLWSWGVTADRYYLTADNQAEPMNEETRAAILKTLKGVRDDFEKRLQTWWKRYGAEKLNCWTYWADA